MRQYSTPVDSAHNGVAHSSYMMSWSGFTTPNSGAANQYNVYSLSGGVLSLGAPYDGVVGVYSTGAVATSTTVNLY